MVRMVKDPNEVDLSNNAEFLMHIGYRAQKTENPQWAMSQLLVKAVMLMSPAQRRELLGSLPTIERDAPLTV